MTAEEKQLLEKLQKQLKDAAYAIEDQKKILDRLNSPPWQLGTVTYINNDGDTLLLQGPGGLMETPVPEDIPVVVGDTVRLNPKTGGIVAITSVPIKGAVSIVADVFEETVEIAHEMGNKVVSIGNFYDRLKRGDRVVLDQTDSVVVKKLPKSNQMKKKFASTTPVNTKWEDIGGLAEAKKLLREAIEEPIRYQRIYRRFGKKQPAGIALHGLPGNGKTELAKAVGTAVANLHGVDEGAFFSIKGPEILSKWVGESEATIRHIFAEARRVKEEKKITPVLFIDEADAILGKRGSGLSSDIERTIVPQFLAEMQGIDGEHAALVILATNRLDTLDEAVLRDGRVDHKIKVNQPTQDDAKEIFTIHFRKIPQSCKNLAEVAAKELWDDKYKMYHLSTPDQVCTMTLKDITSGAMIANLTQVAVQNAIRRNIQSGIQTEEGVTRKDLQDAVAQVYAQNRDVNHRAHIEEFVENNKLQLHAIKRA